MTSMEEDVMTGVEAIKHIADFYEVTSLYELAKSLSSKQTNVQPIQISNYKKGKLMTKKVAERFFDVYGIIISDVFVPGVLSR